MDKYLGKRLDGRYEIQEIIGVGGMAVVYKAYDNVDDRIVAIKILKDEFTGNEDFLRRFRNESKAIAVLSHPNVVKVFDVSFGDLIQYIVMEYIDGITLKEYIEQNGPISWNDAVYFTLQILRGLQHAHDKGVVHRDVKPQNIMVLSDGTIKVTDFGIARFARSEQRTITDKAIGSVHYISPEQARGDSADEKADIYSVGVMLYEMLTGKLPFQAESAVSVAIMQLQKDPQLPRDINGSIPLGLEQITMHAMEKDTGKRYKSAAEMLCDLEAFKKSPAATFEYDYFIDNSPTKFIPSMKNEEEEEKKDKSAIIPILAGISATFVIAIIALFIFVLPKFIGSTGKEIPCPDFTGMTYEEISANDKYDSYNITLKWENNAECPIGEIFRQDPPAGTGIKEKSPNVTVYASSGEKTVKVPDVYGYTEARAKNELEAIGLKVVIEKVTDEEYDANTVIKTVPGRLTTAHIGDEITLYVSTGAPEKFVKLPSLVNFTFERAKVELEQAGLKLGEVTYVNSSKPKDLVVGQNPKFENGKEVGEGSVVDLEVSKGFVEYEYSVTVSSLPTDFITNTTTVSLWKDGTLVTESPLINLPEAEYSYTFKGLKSNAETVIYTVKLKYDGQYANILDIRVNAKDGSWQWSGDYDYPTATISSEPEAPSESVENNGTSSTPVDTENSSEPGETV
ncbi:MAG: Stk1 family PASTA domain-containing Ser/Thr kinase [Clostridia bacterium]|nr:Stk1 family PASTA domain-containing Ser/Thr kinase [Clostridia bacterium]